MKTFFAQVREEAAKRALYRRTRDEIASLSRREAIDLGIYPQDAERIAREAVYG
jgi:uncharacterized protein YjiS (DUF1127 family)